MKAKGTGKNNANKPEFKLAGNHCFLLSHWRQKSLLTAWKILCLLEQPYLCQMKKRKSIQWVQFEWPLRASTNYNQPGQQWPKLSECLGKKDWKWYILVKFENLLIDVDNDRFHCNKLYSLSFDEEDVAWLGGKGQSTEPCYKTKNGKQQNSSCTWLTSYEFIFSAMNR
jgi:hypothetical protein